MTAQHTYMIRDASAFSESFEVTTCYSMAEMVDALQSRESDCGFIGEFLDAIMRRQGVHCEMSELNSFQHDVMSFTADYYDAGDRFRTIEVRVLEVF